MIEGKTCIYRIIFKKTMKLNKALIRNYVLQKAHSRKYHFEQLENDSTVGR